MKATRRLVLSLAWMLLSTVMFAGSAHASFVDFYFSTSADGNPGDAIKGELIGLQNGTNQDPTQILITQAPASMGLNASVSNPYVLQVTTYLNSNASGLVSSTTTGVYGFKVALVGGIETIQAPLDLAFENASGNGVGFNYASTYLGTGYNGALFGSINDYGQTGFSGTTFTAVPEPHEWSLLILLGFGCLMAVKKIRSRKWVPALVAKSKIASIQSDLR